ncbi:MAG: hypothetical protein Q9161_008094 [Pseudevernia consocians]
MTRKRKAAANPISNDGLESLVKPRPRKKQAVTKTNSTATKALIRKNAATSPLIQLPSEVREKVLINLVGDQLIHIKHFDAVTRYVEVRKGEERLSTSVNKDTMSNIDNVITIDSDDGSSDEIIAGDIDNVITIDSDDSSGDEIITIDSDDSSGDEIIAGEAMPTSFHPPSSYRQEQTPSTFRHAICVANQSEQSAYDEAISGCAHIPEGESPEFYVASCEERHAECKMCGGNTMPLGKEDQQSLQVDLNVLGVCRQLYEEANHLLWATNTFSFEDPKTFQKFFGSLNPAQKRNLTSIHISANIGLWSFNSNYHRARQDSNYWGTALNMSTVNMLRGVQALHLCLNQVFRCVSPGSNADLAKKQIEDAQQADINFFLRLRALSVKHVTVTVSDDAKKLVLKGKSAYRWTAIKKTEYAESIRAQLVDPSGAELAKTEADVASLARKIEIRDNAAAGVISYARVVKDRHTDMVRLVTFAYSLQSKAEYASHKADRVSKKSSKKAAKLQQDAKERKEKADVAMEHAQFAVGREDDCRKQFAGAIEKYKRAIARLGACPEDITNLEDAELLMEGLSDYIYWEKYILEEDIESLVSQSEDETLDEDDEDNKVSS